MEKQTNKNSQPIFGLETNVLRAYAYAQINVYGFIQASKFTMGELAKKLNMDRKTFTQRFKEQSWKPQEFLLVINLLENEFNNKLQENKQKIGDKKDE